jgi:hypothetical protein
MPVIVSPQTAQISGVAVCITQVYYDKGIFMNIGNGQLLGV